MSTAPDRAHRCSRPPKRAFTLVRNRCSRRPKYARCALFCSIRRHQQAEQCQADGGWTRCPGKISESGRPQQAKTARGHAACGKDPLSLALGGGEDYALSATVAPDAVTADLPIIGRGEAGEGV